MIGTSIKERLQNTPISVFVIGGGLLIYGYRKYS